MSPILVRPVREQLEHDRIIRLLQTKFRRRYETGMNPGAEQNVAVPTTGLALYPDLVLQSQDRGRKLQGLIEVETGESVNHLEALSQWAHFGKTRAPFQLYVPAGMVDVARRLCEDNQVQVSEIWSYHTVGDQVRFTLVHRNRESAPPSPKKAASTKPAPPAPRAQKTAPTRKTEKAERPVKPEKTGKPQQAGKPQLAGKPQQAGKPEKTPKVEKKPPKKPAKPPRKKKK